MKFKTAITENIRLKKGVQYILSMLMIAILSAICFIIFETRGYHIVAFLLLMLVSVQATFLGIGPVFLSATVSALVWNFFFIPPNFTLHIDKAEDILMFGIFFIIASLNGILTTRVRRQEQLAKEREERTSALFNLTRELSSRSGIPEIANTSVKELFKTFQIESEILLQDGNNQLLYRPLFQDKLVLSAEGKKKADEVFKTMNNLVIKSIDNNSPCYFYPLMGNRINPGLIIFSSFPFIPPEQKAFFETYINQIASALEREFLGELAQKTNFLEQSDKLYKTLFNSISHEFRIPVATIMGASDTLINTAHPGSVRNQLFREIFTASQRLNRLIENLLNMSRLESGLLTVRLDWYDMNDLLNKVLSDLSDELEAFSLKISIADNLPLVKIDFGLIEQVLYNLIYNATQYSPQDSCIEIDISVDSNALLVYISDNGPGFPQEDISKVFKKFYRAKGQQSGGLGLGLSIVKGFIEAHNGAVSFENRVEGGTTFKIQVPTENPDLIHLDIQKDGY